MMKFARLAAVAAAVLLAGCGGGGSGSTAPVAAALTFDLDAAVTRALVSGFTTGTLAGTDSAGNTYTATETYQPQADAFFEGATYKQAKQTLTLTKNGVFAGNSVSNGFFSVSPLRIRGSTHSDGTYSVSTNFTSLPTAATVGQSGAVHNVTTYTSAAKTTIESTSTVSWSLEADTASTAYACLNSTIKYTNGTQAAEADCYRIDSAGQILGGKISIFVNGVTLKLQ